MNFKQNLFMFILVKSSKIPRILSSWFNILVGVKLYHGSIRVLDPLLKSILLNYVLSINRRVFTL